MYRDEQEAALQRAQALEREVKALRTKAESTAETRRRVCELDEELKDARQRLLEDARRLASLEVKVRAMGQTATDPPTRRIALPAGGRGWRIAAGVGIAAALVGLSGAVAWLAFQDPSVRVKVIEVETKDEAAPPPAPTTTFFRFADTDAPRVRAEILDEPAGRTAAKEEYTKGLRLFATSHIPEAIAAFKAAIRLAPSFGDPHRALGSIYVSNGNEKGMCKEFKAYVKLAPHARDTAKIKAEMTKYAATVPACRLGEPEPIARFDVSQV